ncbi:MAG: glycosyltransferase family 4 protein [Limnoraphis sp. WC205]|jgi:glycosyltransferase involved in cell wall biosynthesis|nr:glycosyltransferase family 4 protein [Limnoraphis sp. WC205]
MNGTESQDLESMRVLMVVENISRKMGGEAGKSFYYLRLLRERNIEVRAVCHGRVREELRQEFAEDPEQFRKIHFVDDTWYQVPVWRIGKLFPYRIQDLIFGQIIHSITQYHIRKLAKKLIKVHNMDLVFEPAPITPKGLSFIYNMGVPVVIGPLSGGLEFPPAFQYMDSKISRLSINISRSFSEILHQLIPGKIKASALIVANQQTTDALPKACQGEIYQLIESGVDLDLWPPRESRQSQPDQPVRFIYVGRLVDWKGVQFLIEAFQQVAHQNSNAVLELVGNGQLQQQLENRVQELGLQNQIRFHGWQPSAKVNQLLRECDVFVMPSLREAGGNAIMEAMAIGLPTIATNWAGPSYIVDSRSGILVDPSSPEEFTKGLAQAMIRLAESPQLRDQMGEAAKQRVREDYFDWDSKCDRIVEIFSETLRKAKKLPALPSQQVDQNFHSFVGVERISNL